MFERKDHGQPHKGKYAAYVRVSTEEQDVVNQEHAIKAYLNGGDHSVKWFREEGVSAGTDWNDRDELHRCLDYCRREKTTMIIYSVSRMSRRTWETLRFLEQEVSTGKIKLVVVDNPNLDHKTIGLLSAVAEMERTQIKERTKAALGRIKDELAEKGKYTTKAGKLVTKLGNPTNWAETRQQGADTKKEQADDRAENVWPIIENLLTRGLGYRGTARQLNLMAIPTPTKVMKGDTAKRTEWHASSVRNYALRMGWVK